MSQPYTEKRDAAFDGRIQLNGDAAPELEVIVKLDDRFVVLDHSSGELGRWERSSVSVAPIGRGWFTLDVEDESVTFLPRRPGHFAASTIDLVPVEEVKKRSRRKRREKDKIRKEAEAPAVTRKERKRWRREETDRQSPPVVKPATPAIEPGPVPRPAEPAPMPVEPPSAPVESSTARIDPAPAPALEIRPPSAPVRPPGEPASPWDDLPLPEVPGPKQREKKRSRNASVALPETVPEKAPKPSREKAPKPPREKAPKPPRQKLAKPAAETRVVKPAGPPKRSVVKTLSAGFWHGLKGVAFRISDELRQTGIVPFDRLPAAPARSRPDENHEHIFQEHRLPGGLTRNVCHSCGLVSIGESDRDD